MGYESKLYFVRPYAWETQAETVAVLDIAKMGSSPEVVKFRKLFDTETPFSIRVLGVDENGEHECMVDVNADCYGDKLKYGDKAKLLRQANKVIKEEEKHCEELGGCVPYSRFYVMRDMIKAFKNMDDVYIVHYGY